FRRSSNFVTGSPGLSRTGSPYFTISKSAIAKTSLRQSEKNCCRRVGILTPRIEFTTKLFKPTSRSFRVRSPALSCKGAAHVFTRISRNFGLHRRGFTPHKRRFTPHGRRYTSRAAKLQVRL